MDTRTKSAQSCVSALYRDLHSLHYCTHFAASAKLLLMGWGGLSKVSKVLPIKRRLEEDQEEEEEGDEDEEEEEAVMKVY